MEVPIPAAYIKQVSRNITDDDVSLIARSAKHRQLKKGEALLKEGEICRCIYLVHQGYLRNYTDKDGVTINLNFTFEGGYTTNLKSLYSRKGSEFTIEAGEDAAVWILNFDDVLKVDERIVLYVRRVMAFLSIASEEQSNFHKIYTPTERYHYIEKNNPRLLQRISLSQIASYLGVTRETLSRIRAKK